MAVGCGPCVHGVVLSHLRCKPVSYETQSGARAYLLIDSLYLLSYLPLGFTYLPLGGGGGVENGTPLHEGERGPPAPAFGARPPQAPCWTCTCSRRCADLHCMRFAPARMSETKNGVALAPIVTRKASISLRLGDRARRHRRAEVSGDGVVSPSLAVIMLSTHGVPVGEARDREIYVLTPHKPCTYPPKARIIYLLTPRCSYDTGLPIRCEKEPNAALDTSWNSTSTLLLAGFA